MYKNEPITEFEAITELEGEKQSLVSRIPDILNDFDKKELRNFIGERIDGAKRALELIYEGGYSVGVDYSEIEGYKDDSFEYVALRTRIKNHVHECHLKISEIEKSERICI